MMFYPSYSIPEKVGERGFEMKVEKEYEWWKMSHSVNKWVEEMVGRETKIKMTNERKIERVNKNEKLLVLLKAFT